MTFDQFGEYLIDDQTKTNIKMAHIPGKYKLSEVENFTEVERTLPKDLEAEVTLSGKKFTIKATSSTVNNTFEGEEGKEGGYETFGKQVKGTPTINGNTIDVIEKHADGKVLNKSMEFSAGGFVETIKLGDKLLGKLTFKRL